MGLFKGQEPQQGDPLDTVECYCKMRGDVEEHPVEQVEEQLPYPDLSFSQIAELLNHLLKEVNMLKEKVDGKL